jgi:uncharacterized membrane protein
MTQSTTQSAMSSDTRGFFNRSSLEQTRRLDQLREGQQRSSWGNLGSAERGVSILAGGILAWMGIRHRSMPGFLIAGVGGALIARGATGVDPIYTALGIDTRTDEQRRIEEQGIRVVTAININRSPEELYRYWRNFENLPRIMSYLDSVQVQDDRRSHWVASAPAIVGGSVEWDAEIVRDEPNSLIEWRSLPGSTISTIGMVQFNRAPGDRGTEVHVHMRYDPPGGRLGHWLAKIFGDAPTGTVHSDLRHFKQFMELGEVITTKGQPHGTCLGHGIRSGFGLLNR